MELTRPKMEFRADSCYVSRNYMVYGEYDKFDIPYDDVGSEGTFWVVGSI